MVGPKLGVTVGSKLGVMVGPKLGVMVGSKLGVTVGSKLGKVTRETDGLLLGDVENNSVGLFVILLTQPVQVK